MSDCRWLPAIDAPRSVTDVKGFFGSEEAT